MAKAGRRCAPELRFPGFKGAWKIERVDYFVSRISKPVEVEPDAIYREIGVRSHGKGVFHKEPVAGRKIGNKRVFWVQPNAFVVNIVFGWEQAVALTSEKEEGFIASHRFPMFIPRGDRTDLRFFLTFFLRKRGKYLLELASPGGAGRNKTLGQSEFAALEVTLPTFPEQKEIADFLAAVEEKQVALRCERDLLREYKRGMMQKIFSGEILFKADGGSEFPKWEEKGFGELFDFVRTNSLSRDSLAEADGTVQNIHYGDIHTKFHSHFDQGRESAPFIKSVGQVKAFAKKEYCRPGDLVLADASEDYADIGKAIEIIDVRERSLVAGLHTYLARPEEGKFAIGFPGYMMQAYSVRRQIWRIAQGISVLGISKGNLARVALKVPCLFEQEKIADFLSAIDTKINAVTQQIDRMETFKKGLLQKMFV
ncbi:restriction endonuclease subunit S [Endothiovibrio diazotrophicus]